MKHTSFRWRWVALGVLTLLVVSAPLMPFLMQKVSALGEQCVYSAATKFVSCNGGLVTIPGPLTPKYDALGNLSFYGLLTLSGAQTRVKTTTDDAGNTVCADAGGRATANCIHPDNAAPCTYGVGLYPDRKDFDSATTDGTLLPGVSKITITEVDFDNNLPPGNDVAGSICQYPDVTDNLGPSAESLFARAPFTIPVIASGVVTCTTPYKLNIGDNTCRAPINPDGSCPNGGKVIGDKNGYCVQDGKVIPPTGPGNAGASPDPCPIPATTVWRWAACPVFELANTFTFALDGFINDYLGVGNDISADKGGNYHKAWAVSRNFAVGILVIAGLIMIVSEALGLQIVDAYTAHKMGPMLIFAGIFIPASWTFLVDFMLVAGDDLGHAMGNIIYSSFGIVDPNSISIAGLILGNGVAATGIIIKLVALGPFGILSAIGTILAGLAVGIAVLVARQIAIVALVLSAPIWIVCRVLPGTSKVYSVCWSGFVGLVLFYPAATSVIAICHVLGNLTLGIDKPFATFVAIIIFVAGYPLLILIPKFMGGMIGTLGGIYNDRTKGVFDRGKKTRGDIQAGRKQNFKEGSMWRDNRATRGINALGLRIGAAQAGGGINALRNTARGRSARALYKGAARDARMKRSPLLAESANSDDANNVLGFSGGSEQGLQEAARDIFRNSDGTYDAARGEAAMAGARAVGLNSANASAAYISSMSNKARAVAPGNIRAVDRAVRRLARNDEEYNAIAHAGAAAARNSGRNDLGGTSWISAGRDNKTWRDSAAAAGAVAAATPGMTREMAQYQIISDRVVTDGIKRNGVHAMVSGSDAQARQGMDALSRQIRTAPAGSQDRIQAAMALKELQGSLPSATGGARDIINEVLYEKVGGGKNGTGLGLDPTAASHPTAPRSVADQIAGLTGTGMSGATLTTLARTYAEQTDPGRIGAGSGGAGGGGGGGKSPP